MNEALVWFKSSRSSANGQCVECARLTSGGMAVRDSKQPDGAILRVSCNGWRAFTERLKLSAR